MVFVWLVHVIHLLIEILLSIAEERGHGTTFLRKNLHDQITAQCSVLKNNRDYKNDIDTLYMQLSHLLSEKVSNA